MKGKIDDGRDCRAVGGAVEERARGGKVKNAGPTGDKDVEAEAKGKEPDEKESPARKRGGKVEGKMAKMRLDRPGRKAGGRVGADKAPLTEAAKSGKPKARKIESAMMEP